MKTIMTNYFSTVYQSLLKLFVFNMIDNNHIETYNSNILRCDISFPLVCKLILVKRHNNKWMISKDLNIAIICNPGNTLYYPLNDSLDDSHTSKYDIFHYVYAFASDYIYIFNIIDSKFDDYFDERRPSGYYIDKHYSIFDYNASWIDFDLNISEKHDTFIERELTHSIMEFLHNQILLYSIRYI